MKKFLLLFIGFTFSCKQTPVTLTETEKEEIIKNVTQTLGDYYADVKKHGLTGELAYLDNSAEFFWVPPGSAVSISYDSVVSFLKLNAPSYRSIDNSFDALRIIPITRELATYTGRLKSVITDTSGKTATFKLMETGILIKRKEGWKLLSGQTSLLNQ